MNKDFNWNYESREDILAMINQIALNAMRSVYSNSSPFEPEVRWQRAEGIMTLLDMIADDIDAAVAKEKADEKEFAKSCKATAKAFNDLFEAKVWLTKEDKTNGPAT